MNILYVTSVPSPFQTEFVQNCNLFLEPYTMQLVYTREITEDRAHWGSSDGILLPNKNKIKYLWHLLKKTNPAVVVITDYKSILSITIILWTLFNKRKYFIGPIEVLQQRNFILDQFKKIVFALVAKNSIGIASIGNIAARYYQQLYKGPVIRIPYSFNLSKLLKTNILVDTNTIVFLVSGRLEPFRDPLSAIRLFSKIVIKNPEKSLKLIISGKGSLEKSCKEYIIKHKIQDKVEWVTDFSNWYEIHSIYSKAHVLLALQNYSGWGIIIQEAMAAGMGIVASNTMCAADDLIVDNYNGFLVSKSNEAEVLNAMQQYIDNSELLKTHGFRSKEIVKTIDVTQTSMKFVTFLKQQLCNKFV